ncbi:MAG: antibiotic biosynthesis monooxygenase family protein [Acidimicrobiales bacterium]|jgi:heme-degrading monooxygenase HmoA
MIVEHALLPVIPGQEDAFEASMREALPLITSAPKCHGAEVRRQVEDPSIYLLLVRWESVEAHGEFRNSELFTRWKALTHHFYSTPADVTHFQEPLG